MTKKKTAIVLFQLGGPDSLEAVEPFLYNLFCDPDIIDVPGAFLFRKALARLISSRRAPKTRELYKRIGGSSPILPQTKAQAQRLREMLGERGIAVDVHIAMRYWHPMTDAVIEQIKKDDVNEVIFLPLYPHYSKATTGSSMNEWSRVAHAMSLSPLSTKLIESYHDHPLYIDALIENISRALQQVPANERQKVHLVF
ncbi:MAG TPA: ferrochelatase, partial [Bacteroidota bacterium]|nr:ferrochelatase [Bacteroidota bacterium]